ncbi:FAD-linked oxidoreductase-like protein [Amylostereum chailletii]|nr:FAD-linked oxidoreductase-like protein [Amylostereum chailletii]
MFPRRCLQRAPLLARSARFSSSNAHRRPKALFRSPRFYVASAATVGIAASLGALYADTPPPQDQPNPQRLPPSKSELLRTYIVYSMCSFPTLVDWSPALLDALTSIPVFKQITEALVRYTFFNHFVGGDTAKKCVPLLERMRAENKGVLFSYSVEVDEASAAGHGDGTKAHVPVHKRIVQEMIHSIDVAADFEDAHPTAAASPSGRRTWVAIKLTALLPNHEALIHFSKHLTSEATKKPHSPPVAFPGCPRANDLDVVSAPPASASPMTPDDVADLADLYADLRKISAHAQKRRVRLILDAEHSWYQPAIDSISLALMREFNALPSSKADASSSVLPVIYVTFQAYLRRTPEYLAQSIKDAKAGNYSLGAKLVRGAYHVQENAAHTLAKSDPSSAVASPRKHAPSLSISPDPLPPVWSSKAETDACYNACARVLVHAVAADVASSSSVVPHVPTLGVLFGSHNWTSLRLILDELDKRGLAEKVGEVGGESVLRLGDAVTDRITLAQLFGMSDALTNYLVDRTRSSSPFVIKYVPYGALEEVHRLFFLRLNLIAADRSRIGSQVMPYLARRAIENKAVLGNGQASVERRQALAELRKAWLGSDRG